MKHVFYGHITNRKLELNDRSGFTDVVHSLDDKDIVIEIGEFKPTRTNRANAYYWGVVLKCISDDSGHDPESLHEHFKRKFLTPLIVTIMDEETKIYTTRTLDSQEFWDYVERVRVFAGEFFNIIIPAPSEP